ncbi:MAG TPA: flagellar hook capping FlgD N-terminal domain-containing protein [Deltaproteobacteria bacterium]|nr:flagellar hook capping FlgD N-terminal domain-containing protein [Deltaproteobacteria bacterium]
MSAIGLDTILANQTAMDSAAKATSKVESQKDMFLNLLVKQLQYQDPLNPVENTEFTAQLAQFSQLETLTDMKDSMSQLSQLQGTLNNIQAVSFIGKQVNAQGNIINYTGGEAGINLELEGQASTVAITLYNAEGTPVRTINLQDVAKGSVECAWDGKNNNGENVAPGRYYFGVEATGYDGQLVNTTSYANGTVTGVRYSGGVIYLQVGDKEVALSQVEKISG